MERVIGKLEPVGKALQADTQAVGQGVRRTDSKSHFTRNLLIGTGAATGLLTLASCIVDTPAGPVNVDKGNSNPTTTPGENLANPNTIPVTKETTIGALRPDELAAIALTNGQGLDADHMRIYTAMFGDPTTHTEGSFQTSARLITDMNNPDQLGTVEVPTQYDGFSIYHNAIKAGQGSHIIPVLMGYLGEENVNGHNVAFFVVQKENTQTHKRENYVTVLTDNPFNQKDRVEKVFPRSDYEGKAVEIGIVGPVMSDLSGLSKEIVPGEAALVIYVDALPSSDSPRYQAYKDNANKIAELKVFLQGKGAAQPDFLYSQTPDETIPLQFAPFSWDFGATPKN